ncbi:hypothetical protein AAG747_02640 [Rapidithrix thailandica]|uniref:Reverse transcriptase n=1 Tax=Rapidithrix thailandica TaxID=413964 RepID=A0AAW9S1J1_9BACT
MLTKLCNIISFTKENLKPYRIINKLSDFCKIIKKQLLLLLIFKIKKWGVPQSFVSFGFLPTVFPRILQIQNDLLERIFMSWKGIAREYLIQQMLRRYNKAQVLITWAFVIECILYFFNSSIGQ